MLAALQLPPIYGVTCASDIGEDAFLPRAESALAQGLSLIQLREKDWPIARRDAFGSRLLSLASRFGARVLLNGSADDARRGGYAGVHWTAATLALVTTRPHGSSLDWSRRVIRATVCRAADLDVDFALLG